MRELKQNPQAVVRQVLANGGAFKLTSRGYDTGVVIQPAQSSARPQRFVSGAVLNALKGLAPLTPAQALSWKQDIAEAIEDDAVADPWDHR